MKHKTGRKLLSFLLTLAMVVGLMPGIGLTAKADGTTYNPASTYTGFGDLITNDTEVTISEVSGKIWYVIANDGSTVTLLSKESFGNSKFSSSSSSYASSTVKTYVEGLTGDGQLLAGIKAVLADVSVTNPDVSGKVPYLLSSSEASSLSNTKRMGDGINWWLRSSGGAYAAAFVIGGSGIVNANGFLLDSYGVRPALKLDLSKVTFDSDTKTFSLAPTTYSITCDGSLTSSTVEPDKTSAAAGETVTLTITPDPGTVLDTLTVKDASNNDVAVSADYQFTMPASNVTITATYKESAPPSTYTFTIPSTLTVANSGWNATDGISATGTLASGKKLTVTASSYGEFALVNQDNGTQKVGYQLATASTDTEATTSWTFNTLSDTPTIKPMGIIVEDYSTKPAGTYQDTVIFTAKVEDAATPSA